MRKFTNNLDPVRWSLFRICHETFCYVVLEAMMAGSCVIASTRGAIPELIRHGENGFLVSDCSPEGFQKAITDILQDKNRIYQVGKNATAIVNDVDENEAHAKNMIALYSNLHGI